MPGLFVHYLARSLRFRNPPSRLRSRGNALTAQLQSSTALFNKLSHKPRPSGPVARANPSSVVAIKVLVEIDEVAPVWIVLEFLKPTELIPAANSVLRNS